ncbi:MAG: hypothetical protein ACTSQX_04080 [Candidatus Heimdallarchaeota archaeon]
MVKERSPIMVIFWGFCTIGISWIFWFISTKNEMNAKGADIPTAWIWCIPYVGTIYWFFKYSEGWHLLVLQIFRRLGKSYKIRYK